MALVPNYDGTEEFLEIEYEESIYPSKSYRMHHDEGSVAGDIDGLDAVKQSVFCILNTERYLYPAYSDNYGVELLDLIGQPTDYVIAEAERRITEALTWDSRIESVDDFDFTADRNKLTVTFTVHTIYGDAEEETAVMI